MLNNKKQGVELFIYDNGQSILHAGFCKLDIDVVSQDLYVKYNDENDILKASFNLQFVIQKNILCAFVTDAADTISKNFILFFNNPATCHKIYEIILKACPKKTCENYDDLLKTKFFVPVLQTITSYKIRAPRLKQLITDFIKTLEKNKRQPYLKLLHQKSVGILSDIKVETTVNAFGTRESSNLSVSKDNGDENDEGESAVTTSRKRRHPTNNTSADNPENHVEGPTKPTKRKRKPLPVPAEKIIKKPNFELYEKMDVYGKVKKLLIVLNPKNKKLCYEYYWEQKCQYFVCCGCVINRKTCVARYHKNDKKDGDEYVTFGRAPHVCEWRKYDIEYFFKDRKRIDSTNFEVHEEIKNGVERKALIILSESDKTKCYKLYYTAASKCFSCLECKKLKHCVSARVFDDPIDKKQYAIPGKNDHICNLQEYIPAKKINDEIVESSGFLKLQNQSGPLKIIVFDQKNKKLCYEFTCRKGTNIFSCLGCHEKDNRKLEGNALIQLCTRENGEEYLTLKKWNHCCKMRKYEAEKFQEIIFREPDFIFYREPKDPIINLAIFCSNDKEKFYKYRYHPSQLRFCCLNCRKIKSACNNFAKVCQDENGKEYLYHGKFQHICKPIPYSTITKNKNIEILKASGLPPKKPSKSGGRPCNKNIPPKNIDKSRIIKAEDFELQWSKKGKPDGKLVIFCPENKKLCYELNHEERNLYRCNKCKIKEKIQVTARLYYDDDKNQPYLIRGENEHTCDLTEYIPDKGVLYPSDYHITEMDENEDPIKFVIFIDADKKKCYTYTFWTIGKIFRCRGCMRSGTMVNAKIYKDKNEKNYMKLSPNNHVCVPEDYVSEGKDILPPQRFTLMPSKNGTVNGKLFLFDLEKPFYGYWFNFSKTVYYCCSCRKEGKQVKAKLCEKDDGEKYVEMYHHPKHVCEIRNILEENKVVKAENFKIDTNSSGEKVLHISKTESSDKNLVFDFDKNLQAFCCRKCKIKQLFHTATICKNMKNEEFLVMNGNFLCQ